MAFECTAVTMLANVAHLVTVHVLHRVHLCKRDPVNALSLYNCREVMMLVSCYCSILLTPQ